MLYFVFENELLSETHFGAYEKEIAFGMHLKFPDL